MTDAERPTATSGLLWLALAAVLLIGTGIGIRDPWPADEPRFALIARDMVASGDWLFPRVGGDLYPDKPPLFFWLLAVFYLLTGSIRASFLIPSFIAACVSLALVHDLARRLFGREAALAAALILACTVQFITTMRGAQIDPTLVALTTLSLYGLLRHLLLGPAWGWYFIGGFAAGLGVITKGVGFLPLLVLIPYGITRARGFAGLPMIRGGWQWAALAGAFLLGVAIWLVPMLIGVASRGDPALIAYRNGILVQQTVQRYASAWHHFEPWYFFIVEVIPVLWLPFSALLFWLVPRWKSALRARDARVWIPLAWVLLTVLFFSISKGKRGIYVFPALPALALAAAPFLPDLFRRRGVRALSLVLAGLLLLPALVLLAGHALQVPAIEARLAELDADAIVPLAIFLAAGLIVWLIAWRRAPLIAWPGVVACLAIVVSYGIAPQIDSERSARGFMQSVLRQVPRDRELAFAGYKEQFLLYLDRPVVNFGHRRWLEGPQESYDAALWLNSGAGRTLLIPAHSANPCFSASPQHSAGRASGDDWLLVEAPASADCAARGNSSRTLRYVPLAKPEG